MHSSAGWLIRPRPVSDARLRLFCFHYAGGGASAYRAWAPLLPAGVELCAVQLPGREERIREPLHRNMEELVRTLGGALLPELKSPFAFFGHSMGALLAFELAQHLSAQYGIEPNHLFVSARRAPHLPPNRPPRHALPTSAFIAELRRMGGTPEAVLKEPELMELLLPIIRADFCLIETYVHAPREPLRSPLTAFAGEHDSEAPVHEIEEWRSHTSGHFAFHALPGDHFFLNSHRPQMLRLISSGLAGLLQD